MLAQGQFSSAKKKKKSKIEWENVYISNIVKKSLIRKITLNGAKLGKKKKSEVQKNRTTEIMLRISVILY